MATVIAPDGHHGADRDVELAGDHQQADGNGDDAEVGGDVQPAGHAGGLQEGQAAEDGEEDQDGDQAEEGPGLGAAQKTAEEKLLDMGCAPGSMRHDWRSRWRQESGPHDCCGPDESQRLSGRPAVTPASVASMFEASTMPGPVRTGNVGRSVPKSMCEASRLTAR